VIGPCPGKDPVPIAVRQRNPQHFHRVHTGLASLRTGHPHVCAQAGKQYCRRPAGISGLAVRRYRHAGPARRMREASRTRQHRLAGITHAQMPRPIRPNGHSTDTGQHPDYESRVSAAGWKMSLWSTFQPSVCHRLIYRTAGRRLRRAATLRWLHFVSRPAGSPGDARMAQGSACRPRLAYCRLPQSRTRNLPAGVLPQVAGHCSAMRRTCSIACAAGARPAPWPSARSRRATRSSGMEYRWCW
jgi:hypothetical protein